MARATENPKIHVSMNLQKSILDEIKREMIRTGQTRTALIRIAWREYMDRHATEIKRR